MYVISATLSIYLRRSSDKRPPLTGGNLDISVKNIWNKIEVCVDFVNWKVRK